MNHRDYDNWKLSTPDYYDDDRVECERCNDLVNDETMQEYSWIDADGDRQTKFICENCVAKIEMGDI